MTFLNSTKVLIVFYSIILIIFFTHMGADSPYSWHCKLLGGWVTEFDDGHFGNGDAGKNLAIIKFFYEPSPTEFNKMENIDIPLYYFFTSTLIGLTRSFSLSHYLSNLIFIFLVFLVFRNLLIHLNIPNEKILISGIAILSLPFFTHYLGQHMYYLVESCISFLVIMTAIKLTIDKNTEGALFGLLGAILIVNYDLYQLFTTLAIYLLFFYRPKNLILFFFISGISFFLWRMFFTICATSPVNLISSNILKNNVLPGWMPFLENPLNNMVFPFIVSQVGIVIAFKMLLGHFYWPLLVFFFYYLSKLNFDPKSVKYSYLPFIQIFVFFLIVTLIIPFDWELNPRRAIPLIFAFSMGLVFIILNLEKFKNAKRILLTLIAFSYILSFSDTLFKVSAVHINLCSETIRSDPKAPLANYLKRLDKEEYGLAINKQLKFGTYDKANGDNKYVKEFVLSQAFCFFLIFILFYLLEKTKLVDFPLTKFYCLVYLFSIFMRFITV